MSTSWLARLGSPRDNYNPVLVKEVQQGLRSKVFWIVFGLLLVSCLVTSLFAFGIESVSVTENAGKTFFPVFYGLLSFIGFVVVPSVGFHGMAKERSRETWVLLSLTTLSPRKVLRGQLWSTLLQSVLYSSAVVPFVFFVYYLGGVSLIDILISLGVGWLATLFLSVMGVSIGAFGRGALGVFLRIGLVLVLFSGFSFWMGLFGAATIGGRLFSDPEFWIGLGVCVWLLLSYGALMFEGAASRLMLSSQNYALVPRLIFFAQWVASLGIAVVVWWLTGGDDDVWVVSQILMMVHFAVVGTLMVSDRDGLAKVLQQARGFSFLKPGALRIYMPLVLMVLASTAVFVGFYWLDTGSLKKNEVMAMLSAPMYFILYLSVSILVMRIGGPRSQSLIVPTMVVLMILVALGSLLPPALSYAATGSPDNPILNFLNPTYGLVLFADNKIPRPFLGALAVLTLACVIATRQVLKRCDDAV